VAKRAASVVRTEVRRKECNLQRLLIPVGALAVFDDYHFVEERSPASRVSLVIRNT
jgi:hypothetical protein